MLYRRQVWLSILALDVVLFVIAAIIGQQPKEHWKDVGIHPPTGNSSPDTAAFARGAAAARAPAPAIRLCP